MKPQTYRVSVEGNTRKPRIIGTALDISGVQACILNHMIALMHGIVTEKLIQECVDGMQADGLEDWVIVPSEDMYCGYIIKKES